ncbi:MAG: hypothetical protein WC043_04110 [Pseudobdellovibrionaceae bacterium]
MEKSLKSICLMIRKDQHDRLQDMGVNVSGFVRDMIDDRLSEATVILNVSPETRALYDQIISTSPNGDIDLEPYLREALKNKLKDHITAMQKLHESLSKL